MNRRIGYIDQIKGLAIFLVVLAHVMAFTYQNWEVVLQHKNVAPLLWWRIIYSFHMPLFFCVSGYLCSIKKGYTKFVRNKVRSLIIPFSSFFILESIIYKNQTIGGGPWFLKTLFIFMMIYAISHLLFKILRYENSLLLIIIMLILFIAIRRVIYYINSDFLKEIIDLHHLSKFNYTGFLLGVILKEFKNIYEKLNKEKAFTFFFIVYFVLIYLKLQWNISFHWYFVFTVISAIMAIWLFFDLRESKQVSNKNSKKSTRYINHCLELLGQYSLHIYLLHLFFRIRIIDFGNYLLSLADENVYTLSITLCTIQLIYAAIITTIIIVLCFLTTRFIEHSKYLNYLLFGKIK